jgi:polyvinyl alcohol dehydrogenase (cytochrome)
MLLAAVLLPFVPSPSRAAASCAADHPGGDWPSYGHDLSNTRSQPLETTITGGAAATLAPVWTHAAALDGDAGVFSNTPVVAHGCVFTFSSSGWAYALNADTGELVWRTQVGSSGEASLAVAEGKVVVHSGSAIFGSPGVVALDQATGSVLWSTVLTTGPGSGVTSSPVVFDGMVFSGVLEGLEFTADNRKITNGSFVITDLDTGEVLVKTHVIPDEDFAAGSSGGNIWATAVVDTAAHFAYVGTAASYSREEHPRTNAILKIEVDRSSDTFGQIVDFYSGVRDYYLNANGDLPCVALAEGTNFAEGLGRCFRGDHDFGGSPVLYTDGQGRTIVGEAQGSGVFHAVDTATMEPVWTALVAGPGAARVSTAMDGDALYSAEIGEGTLYSLVRETGDYRWMRPAADGFHYNPPAVANGVVYMSTGTGMLLAFDARSGFPVLVRPMHADAGVAAALGGGVAIARNTVYAVAGGTVIAYRPAPEFASQAALIDAAVLPAIPASPVVKHLEKPV